MSSIIHRSAGSGRGLRSFARIAVVGAATVVLAAGCKKESKNPVDYLPQTTGGYVALNFDKFRNSPSMKRLGEIIDQQSGQGLSTSEYDKVQKVYFGFDIPDMSQGQPTADNVKYYTAFIGEPGLSQEVIDQAKKEGATESKIASRDVYTSGTSVYAGVATHGIIMSNNAANLERMINVSEKKETGARASAQFTEVNLQADNHAIAFAIDAKPLIAQAKPALQQNPMAAMHQPAIAALDDVTMLSVNIDWDTHPIIEILLHVADKDKANTLAGTINGFLTMGKAFAAQEPEFGPIVNSLQAETNSAGVQLKIEIPAETANKLFEQLENNPYLGQPGAFPANPTFQ